ncbi:hypothetical protein DPMN_126246 [Dreissena polymorpha]|uniref:Uncharacterized protein n=1 Tax=Dreissena polymorpha TaxID=45954 RepID=A0A9D4GWN9_DREPO|nr:hypothetical protein DPMN_126246 [Dreissena polymorpha]
MARSDSTNCTSSTATYLLQSDGEVSLLSPHVQYGYVPPSERCRGQTPLPARPVRLRTSFRAMAMSDSTTRTPSTATYLLQSDGNVRFHYPHVQYGYVPPSERLRGQSLLTARLIRLRTTFRAMARSDSTTRTSSTATYLLQINGELRLHYLHV